MNQALPERELPECTLLIADLHLDLSHPDGAAAFCAWLERQAGLPALIVLGDLFDAWVGPAQARLPGARPVLEALAAATRRGTRLLVVAGNRDFLLDERFAAETGAEVLPQGLVARVGAQRVLLLHGDTLCTRDRAYQRLRRVVRSAPLRWLALRLPLAVGTALARRLRRASVVAVGRKLPEQKSLQAEAAESAARAARADLLVCGHAHLWRDQRLPGGARWIVLDAFGGERCVLELTAAGPRALGCGARDGA